MVLSRYCIAYNHVAARPSDEGVRLGASLAAPANNDEDEVNHFLLSLMSGLLFMNVSGWSERFFPAYRFNYMKSCPIKPF